MICRERLQGAIDDRVEHGVDECCPVRERRARMDERGADIVCFGELRRGETELARRSRGSKKRNGRIYRGRRDSLCGRVKTERGEWLSVG